MRLRAALLSLVVALAAPMPVAAQDVQTLADIRQELSVLFVEMQRLRTQLSTTSAPQTNLGGDTALARLDSIEAEVRRLTARTEALQLRVEGIVSDGTNRIGDLEFRLCELEAGCDIGALGATSTLGGDVAEAPAPSPQPTQDTGSTFAVGEQGDFDRAKAAFDAGQFADAAVAFEVFTQTYSGGPLNAEAHFLRGESLAQTGDWPKAARSYLNAFSGAPEGPRAPEALLKLGTSLGELGQTDEACLTLGEVPIRYPNAPAALDANSARSNLGCS